MSQKKNSDKRKNKIYPSLKKGIKKIFTSVSFDSWILFFSLIIISILGFIIQQIKYGWADDPFQKIILAPLGEEPTKIAWAFLVLLGIAIPLTLMLNIFNKKPLKKVNFQNIFNFGFVYICAFGGFLFGYFEFLHQGGVNSPSLHLSLTTIAGILIVITYKNLKHFKKIFSFFTLIIPMVLHSIANQYMNFSSVGSNDKYLVIIAKFLRDNTFLKDQTIYASTLLLLALVFLFIYTIKYVFLPWIYCNQTKDADMIDKINLKYWLNSNSNVIFLAIFSFIIAYFIISGIWYDLTINIAAGLICSLITVFLFTYLFQRKEKIIWSAVKEEVNEGLKIELSGLFTDIMLPLERIDDKYAIEMPEGKDENEVFRKHRLEQFKKLVEADKIEFANSYKDIIAEGGFGTLFISRKNYLNEIEYKYSKHFDPEIILSIIKLQRYLRLIDTKINIKAKNKLTFETDKQFFERLSGLFHEVLKELYFLYEKDLIIIY
jgi:hypothetical protein